MFEQFDKMDVNDQIFFLETSPLLKYLLLTNKKRNFWVNSICEEREIFGEYHTLYPKLLEQPVKFYEYMDDTRNFFLHFGKNSSLAGKVFKFSFMHHTRRKISSYIKVRKNQYPYLFNVFY